jgi:hypothetical protein
MLALSNTAGLNIEYTPIFSEATIGQGWQNAAFNTHYAENAIVYRGSIDLELQGYDTMMRYLYDWFLMYRAYSRSIDISPDGYVVYQHRNPGDDGTGATQWIWGTGSTTRHGVWCESFTMTVAEASAITASVGGVALERTVVIGGVGVQGGNNYIDGTVGSYILSGASAATPHANFNPLNPSDSNLNPIPFWKTLACIYIDVDAVSSGWDYTTDTAPRDETTGTKVGGSATTATNTQALSWDFTVTNNIIRAKALTQTLRFL